MKTFLRIVKGVLVVLVLAIVGLVAYVQLAWQKKYDAPYRKFKQAQILPLLPAGNTWPMDQPIVEAAMCRMTK